MRSVNRAHEELCSGPEWAGHLVEAVLEPFVARFDLGDDMLEAGPGWGAATAWLHRRVRRLTAVEVDSDTADRLRARFGDAIEVVTGDCAATGLACGGFDSVGTFTMLHHVPTPARQHAVLAECFRLLRPGGVLVGSDSLASDDLHRFHEDDTYNPLEPARLLVQLQVLGFERVTVAVDEHLLFAAYRPAAPGASPPSP